MSVLFLLSFRYSQLKFENPKYFYIMLLSLQFAEVNCTICRNKLAKMFSMLNLQLSLSYGTGSYRRTV